MYAQLGDIIFDGRLTPESKEYTKSASYAEHALIDGKPRLQKTGDALDEIKLVMHLHRSFCSPESEIAKLNSHMAAGTSLRYVTGTGSVVGTFVITSTKQAHAAQGPTGLIIETTVEVNLKEAGDGIAATSSGFAFASSVPAVSVEQITPISPTLKASQSVTAAVALNTSGGASLTKASASPAQFSVRMRQAAAQFRKMRTAVNDAVDRVNETSGDIFQATRDLESALVNSKNQIDSVRQAAEANNIADALAEFDALQPLVFDIRRQSELLASYNSTRIPLT